MASNVVDDSSDEGPDRLPSVFDSACQLHEQIEESTENSNSDSVQRRVREAIELLVKSTRMVNSLALFSRNETLDEVATADMKYLLLPAFLGDLTLKSISDDRRQLVDNSRVYFKDYLIRCKCYEIAPPDLHIPGEEGEAYPSTTSKSLDQMNKSRAEKINRFQEKKEIETKIKIMKKILKDCPDRVDDQQMRSYYTNWIKLWMNISLENMESIHSELEILEHIDKMRRGTAPKPPPKPDLKPMKPILITKDMTRQQLQRGVFGTGSRCMPTMTEDEWFEKEVREGKIVLDFDNVNKPPEKEESDSDEDIDDPEKLQYNREKDDWKDSNRRGEGNKDGHG